MAKNNNNPAVMVNLIASTWFGKVGGIIAILSVVVAPITSADSSFRVLRMSIADWFKISQNPMRNRLLIAVPMFAIAIILMQIDFAIIWRYFAFSNQTLATIMLWTGAMYLVHHKRAQFHWFLSLPAGFMTAVVVTYICVAPEGLRLSSSLSNTIGIIIAVILYGIFLWKAGTFNVSAKNEGQEPVLEGDV